MHLQHERNELKKKSNGSNSNNLPDNKIEEDISEAKEKNDCIQCPSCRHPDQLDDIVNEIIHESNAEEPTQCDSQHYNVVVCPVIERRPEYHHLDTFDVSFPITDIEGYVLPPHSQLISGDNYIHDNDQCCSLADSYHEEHSGDFYTQELPNFKTLKYAKTMNETPTLGDDSPRRESVIRYMNI